MDESKVRNWMIPDLTDFKVPSTDLRLTVTL